MKFNYAKTVAILSVCQAFVVSLGHGPDSGKAAGLGILGVIIGVPIALFFDYRSHRRSLREQHLQGLQLHQGHTALEPEKLPPSL